MTRRRSYTRDRDARQKRIAARGDKVEPTDHAVKCATCGDLKRIVVQGEGWKPCPDCQGAA